MRASASTHPRGRGAPARGPSASQHTASAPLSSAPAPAEYRLIGKKGEGTFSEVLKAQCIKNGKYVAIKCMKNHFDSLDQVRHSPDRAAAAAARSSPLSLACLAYLACR